MRHDASRSKIYSHFSQYVSNFIQFYFNYSKFVPKNSNAEDAMLNAKIGVDTAFFGRALELVKPTCELLTVYSQWL